MRVNPGLKEDYRRLKATGQQIDLGRAREQNESAVVFFVCLILATLILAGTVLAYWKSQPTTADSIKAEIYEKFISGECWLNSQTRDIDCVEYVGGE